MAEEGELWGAVEELQDVKRLKVAHGNLDADLRNSKKAGGHRLGLLGGYGRAASAGLGCPQAPTAANSRYAGSSATASHTGAPTAKMNE